MNRTTGRRALLAFLCAAALTAPALAEPLAEYGGPASGSALETPDIEYGEGRQGFTADFDYSGVLDESTGLPASGAVTRPGETGLVYLSDSMSYDPASGRYVFSHPDGEFRCTAADGMILSQPVSVESGDSAISVYRDGAEVNEREWQSLEVPGEYAVYAGMGDTGRRMMTFTIVGAHTNRIYGYSVPEGFFIRRAERNGEETGFERYFVNMEGEGDYVVEYRCPAADLTYTLTTTIDRTPPELLVTGRVGRDGRIHSSATFSVTGEDGTVSILRDGAPYTASYSAGEGVLKEPGAYSLSITDEAGNTMTYDFEIMVYLDSNSVLFLLLVLAALGTVTGLVIWKRKNFKTR